MRRVLAYPYTGQLSGALFLSSANAQLDRGSAPVILELLTTKFIFLTSDFMFARWLTCWRSQLLDVTILSPHALGPNH